MPCYSKIETKLIDIKFILEAAKTLGIKVDRVNDNTYRLNKGNQYATIEREKAGEKFFVKAYSASNLFRSEIIQPLTKQYATDMTKSFYKSKGYTASAGTKPGELVFTKYS